MNLNYIIKNEFFDINNDSLKIINIYNLRFFENTEWYNILFAKISEEVQKIIKVIYDCNIKFNYIYMVILKRNNLLELFNNTKNELNTKTFIKYFYDNNMINEKLLLDLSEETFNSDYAVILNYHNPFLFSLFLIKIFLQYNY